MNPIALAERFAQALDEEDYTSAAALIASTCVYTTGEETHRGPAAIIASYRSHGNWAAQHLEQVRYESRVRAGERGGVVVTFVDHVEHAGHAHTYQCEQHLSFDEQALISAIQHVELPGEREGLQEFFVAVGLARAR